jgi:hypothetical protein
MGRNLTREFLGIGLPSNDEGERIKDEHKGRESDPVVVAGRKDVIVSGTKAVFGFRWGHFHVSRILKTWK